MNDLSRRAEEYFPVAFPMIYRPHLSMNDIQLWTFRWLGEVWIPLSQMDKALQKRPGYCYSWATRCPEIFTSHRYKVARIFDLEPSGKRRKMVRKRGLISLKGLEMLSSRIGTPEAAELNLWAFHQQLKEGSQ